MEQQEIPNPILVAKAHQMNEEFERLAAEFEQRLSNPNVSIFDGRGWAIIGRQASLMLKSLAVRATNATTLDDRKIY